MSKPLQIGYKASAEQFDPRQLVDFSVLAEQLGYDSVAISDHFQPWKHTDGHSPFSFAWMAAVAVLTERIRIGSSVVTPTFRYHPSIVAQAMGTIGCLAPGRVFLGIGTGEAMNETPATGDEFPAFKERFARMRESVELMRQLWSEERVSFEGEYYKTHIATIYDRPEGGIPIYMAASGAMAARYAGRYGDGFICTSGKKPELYTETLIPSVAEGAENKGRDVKDIEMTIEMKVSYDHDRDRAMQDTRKWAALALAPEQKSGVEDPMEMERLADELSAEQAATRWIVSTDADEAAAKIQTYIDYGFSHLIFHFPGDDQERALRLFAEDVMPKLRG